MKRTLTDINKMFDEHSKNEKCHHADTEIMISNWDLIWKNDEKTWKIDGIAVRSLKECVTAEKYLQWKLDLISSLKILGSNDMTNLILNLRYMNSEQENPDFMDKFIAKVFSITLYRFPFEKQLQIHKRWIHLKHGLIVSVLLTFVFYKHKQP